MLSVLANPTYSGLFAAQLIALVGTGLMTVALGLLAFDIAGPQAGAVLGTALAIKMIAYVGLAPVANAAVDILPRKAVLIGADLIRAAVALCLPFIDAVWQIYAMIFVLQAASATFTPTFQALIPDILEDEQDYTKALSLSRLAYDIENLVSPTLAGLLLLVTTYSGLFVGTTAGFLGSALLVVATALPPRKAPPSKRSFLQRLTRGSRIYLATPRLRGLLSLNMSAAAAGAFVIVNTVVIVRSEYQGSETDVAYVLAAFGAGSMLAALALPRLLSTLADRSVMMVAAAGLAGVTLLMALSRGIGGLWPLPVFLAGWALIGLLYSAVQTPSGRLLRRSAHPEDRASLFAAQFALSHACWLLTYPLAGWAGEAFGMAATMAMLGLLALAGVAAAAYFWPKSEEAELSHGHPDLPPDHPHLKAHGAAGHRHIVVIDDEHRAWPSQG